MRRAGQSRWRRAAEILRGALVCAAAVLIPVMLYKSSELEDRMDRQERELAVIYKASADRRAAERTVKRDEEFSQGPSFIIKEHGRSDERTVAKDSDESVVADDSDEAAVAEHRRLDSIIKIKLVSNVATTGTHAGCVTVDVASPNADADPPETTTPNENSPKILDIGSMCGDGAPGWKCPNCFLFTGDQDTASATGSAGYVCVKRCSNPVNTGITAKAVNPLVFINGHLNGKTIDLVFPTDDAETNCKENTERKTVLSSSGSQAIYCLRGLQDDGFGYENQLYGEQAVGDQDDGGEDIDYAGPR